MTKYKEGKMEGYDFEAKKKLADDMKSKGVTQFTLRDALKLKK